MITEYRPRRRRRWALWLAVCALGLACLSGWVASALGWL